MSYDPIYAKAYREKNKKRIIAYQRDYKRQYRAALLEYGAEYRKQHREALAAAERDRRNSDPESYYARRKEIHAANIDRYREYWRTSKARGKSKSEIMHNPEKVMKTIDAALAKGLPRFIREDVLSTMVIAVLEGKLLLSQVEKAARRYVTEYNSANGIYKNVSLDAPIPGMDGLTYLDRLAGEI